MAVRAETSTEREPAAVATLRILLLGGFGVEREGTRLPESAWKRPQARMLVKLLATEPSHRLHREQIAEIFWPDGDEDTVGRDLRRLLYLVRRSLPAEASTVLGQHDEVVALDMARVWIDADAFEEAARAALAGGSIPEAEAALAQYGGELLPEERYAEWTERRREELAALQRELLLSLARTLARQGEPESAIDRLRQLLAVDPSHEVAHREQMRLHAAAGNRQEALRQYERCRDALAEGVGVEPDAETEALRAQIEAGTGVSTAPVLPPAAARRWRTPMIGRERALDLVLVPPIPAGTNRRRMPPAEPVGLVLVGGEAGVGKTRLAAEAAREAGRRGCLVLWGTCSAQSVYGPFVEALEQYAGGLSPAERAEMAQAHPEIARILPSLDPVPAGTPADSAGDELRLFAAVARILTHLAALHPVLLVLDDLQLADDATLALLTYLARLPATRRNWLILGTYRVEEAGRGSALVAALAELQRTVPCRQVDLLRLGRRECIRLAESVLGDGVEDAVGEHIFRTSLGNPLFAVELIGALRASGELVQSGAGWRRAGSGAGMPVPSQVADLIASRIGALDTGTRRFLSLAAVSGMSTSFAVIEKCAEFMEGQVEDLLNALERAVEARVLEEVGASGTTPTGFRFQHPLFREAAYAQIGPARQAHLHGIVARAIETVQPHDLEALAHHYARSGNREKSVLYLERAGDRARLGYASTLAEAHYRELLGLLLPTEDAAHRAHVQLKLGTVLNVLGRYDEALAVLDEAAARLAAAGDVGGLGRAVAAIGRVHVMRATASDAVERLEGAITELEGQIDPLVLCDLSDALARCLVALGRYAESEGVSKRAIETLQQRVGTPEGQWHLARAGLQRASAAYFVRPSAEARMMLLDVMPVIERSGDPELLTHAYNLAAYSALAAGDLLESCRYYEQALEAAERMADPGRAGRLRCLLGRSWFFVGKGEQGLRIAEEGYAELASFGPSLYLAFGSHMLGVIYLGMGRWQEAREHFAEVCAIAGENREAVRLAAYRAAQLDLLEDHAERARDRLEPLQSADAVSYDAVLICAHLAWACAALGNEDQALTLADRAVQQARVIESRLCLVEVLCACGATLVELRHWDAAERTLAEGLALAREIGYVWHEAVMQLLLARLCHRQGKLDAACTHRGNGRALLHGLGGDRAACMADAYSGMKSH